MVVTFKVVSPESLTGLAELICFIANSTKAYEKRFGHLPPIKIDWVCVDSNGNRYKIAGQALVPEGTT
jgi:hypothetical protein